METITSKQVIESVVEAAKVTIAYGYADPMYTKPPPVDKQVAISCLLAPLIVEIIMDCNNFLITKMNSAEPVTTFKQEVNESIDVWLSTIETATEFAAKTLQ